MPRTSARRPRPTARTRVELNRRKNLKFFKSVSNRANMAQRRQHARDLKE